MTEESSQLRRFVLDHENERSVGYMRLGGAFLVFLMGLILISRGTGPVGWVIIAATWIIGVLWLFSSRASLRRASQKNQYYVELGPLGLELCMHGTSRHVQWAQIDNIELDEEKLVIWITCHNGQQLRIDPIWQGIGLYELMETIRSTLMEATHDGGR